MGDSNKYILDTYLVEVILDLDYGDQPANCSTYVLGVELLPPSHNIRDFKFLFALFDHSSYSKILKLLFIFLTYFIIQSTLSTTLCFYICINFLNKTSVQTVQAKTQNILYYGTEGVERKKKLLRLC